MGDLLDRPDFTDNVGLQAMRNAWREGHEHFERDRYAIYPVDMVIAEAEARLSIGQPCGPGCPTQGPARDGMGTLRKTCGTCGRKSRNNPCDKCYQTLREIQDPGWGFGMRTKFCVMCSADADADGKLCAACRALLNGRAPE